MKKIVFITNSLGFGGAEKMLTFVANSLSKRYYSCSIINLNTVGNYINEHSRNINEEIRVFTIEAPKKGENIRKYHISKIRQIAKEFNTDILIGFTGFPNTYAKIVGTMLNVPSIMSERGDPTRTTSKDIKSAIMRFIINRSRGGVFQTEGAMKYYGKGLQKRSVVIPNPIFIDGKTPYVKQEEREKTVVSVGRLDNEQKRYDVMLAAFKIFSEKHPEYTLKMYGKGPDEEKIRVWADDRGLSGKVNFMGLTTQPMQDIAKDGMFLITSDYEGISNALLEAMAVGLPCVSTDHTPGGARLLIQDHENGLLAPVGNAEKLAAAMSEFAEDIDLSEKCGRNARNVLTRFDPERIIDMWEQYFCEIVNN